MSQFRTALALGSECPCPRIALPRCEDCVRPPSRSVHPVGCRELNAWLQISAWNWNGVHRPRNHHSLIFNMSLIPKKHFTLRLQNSLYYNKGRQRRRLTNPGIHDARNFYFVSA